MRLTNILIVKSQNLLTFNSEIAQRARFEANDMQSHISRKQTRI